MDKPGLERAWVNTWIGAVVVLLLLSGIAGLVRRRAALRSARPTDANVRYGSTPDGRPLFLDVFRPKVGAGKRPAVVLIHGGGWARGSKADVRIFGEALAKEGFVAFSVGYRLATRTANQWPAQLDDVQRAVRWIRAHAAEYNVDPKRIGAFGGSAGGHLAAFLGTRDTRDNSDPALAKYSSRVRCVVDTCGPTDFTDARRPALYPSTLPLLQQLIGKTQAEAPELYRDASPIAFVDRHSAPFLIFHGTADTLVPFEQSERMRSALAKAGVEARLITMLGDGHLFTHPENLKLWGSETTAFLKRHLRD